MSKVSHHFVEGHLFEKQTVFDLPAKSFISRYFLSLETWNDHLFLNERIYLISVLLEILDQYLLGGIDASKEDLDHVFLRFGK